MVKKNADAIGEKVLANAIRYENGGNAKEWNVNGEKVTIAIEKR